MCYLLVGIGENFQACQSQVYAGDYNRVFATYKLGRECGFPIKKVLVFGVCLGEVEKVDEFTVEN